MKSAIIKIKLGDRPTRADRKAVEKMVKGLLATPGGTSGCRVVPNQTASFLARGRRMQADRALARK